MTEQVLVPPEQRFKRNAKALLALFVEYFDGLEGAKRVDMTHINLSYMALKEMEMDPLITSFISNSSSHWDKLLNKDDNYLLKNAIQLMPDRYHKKMRPYLDAIKDRHGGLLLDTESLQEAWNLTHNMVKCSIHYLYDNRKTLTDEQFRALEPVKLSKAWKLDLNKKIYEEKKENDSSSEDVNSAEEDS